MRNAILTPNELERVVFGPHSQNYAIRTAEVLNEFTITPDDPSLFRDVTPGDGSVSYNGEFYSVQTTASGTSTQSLETARIGQYRSGSTSTGGIYVRKTSPPVGTAEWGLGMDAASDDEAFWRYNSDGTFEAVIKKSGVETVLPRSLWNDDVSRRSVDNENGNESGLVWGHDYLDGDGESGAVLDVSTGHIFHVMYTWYGQGPVTFLLVGVDTGGKLRANPAVTFMPTDGAPFDRPSHPVMARLDNDGIATADELFVGGRQYSVIGSFDDEFRETSHLNSVSGVGSSPTEVITFRRKTGYEGIDLDIENIETITTGNCYIHPHLDGTITNTPTWEDPGDHRSADETAIEVSNDATIDTSSGEQFGGNLVGSGKNSTTLGEVGSEHFPIPRQKPVTILVKSLTGQTEDVDMNLIVQESW